MREFIKKLIFMSFAFFFFIGFESVHASDELPSLYLETPQSPFVERNLWQDGKSSMTGNEDSFENVDVRVRGRGNDTWVSYPDKRPLRLRFSEARSMLGSEYEARNWILLANYADRSLLRNYAALGFANNLGGIGYSFLLENIHLYVNGEYMGVYMLTDEREVHEGRLRIEESENPAESGFFIELDARAPQDGTLDETYVIVDGLAYDIAFPDYTPEHIGYVKNYLQTASDAISNGTFEEICKVIDLDSFIDFYIVQELFKNADVHNLSVFMYIDGVGDERRLFMGPVWDFDTAAGNRTTQLLGNDEEDLYVAVFNDWYRHLMNRSAFFDLVVERWNNVKNTAIPQTINDVKQVAEAYRMGFERNFEKYTFDGMSVAAQSDEILAIKDFMGQVEFLTDWIETRAAWLDTYFNDNFVGYASLQALLDYYTFEKPITVIFEEEEQNFDYSPIILCDRTMLTVEDTAKMFNMDVKYDYDKQEVHFNGNGIEIIHRVGQKTFIINGEVSETKFPSVIINGQIFVHLYIINIATEYTASWQTDTGFLKIYKEN